MVSLNNTFRVSLIVLGSLLVLQACSNKQQTDLVSSNKSIINDTATVDRAAQQIDEAGFMQHVNILASDEFEGRAPSTSGGEKTVAYLEQSFAKLGLKPAFGDSYRQAVDLMALTVTNEPALTLNHSDGSQQVLEYTKNSIVSTSLADTQVNITDSDLVFVGYGVVAPEFNWNDYNGIDMTGKTAVILVNDPGYRKPEGTLFKGRTMTYYGRWTYKYEEAARQGAVAAIIVHETAAAGYPWGVISGGGTRYNLFEQDDKKDYLAVKSWVTQSAAQELFTKNGLSYQEMVIQAGEPGFKPIALNSNASVALMQTSRQSKSYNVGAVIEGSEQADEIFIYTAHWDHLGIKPGANGEDLIFNGAQDNATGTAALIELAQAFKALPQPPKRSVMFLAVTAEESGLLGSQAYADKPPYPMSKTVAGINLDSMSTIGATDDIVVVGYGNSEMDDYLQRYSEPVGRVLTPESTPEKGFFYRSDHFNLAKKGVPMLYAKAGIQVRNKPAGYGAAQTKSYIEERYHKAGDEVHAQWDNGGILQDLDTFFKMGVAISDSNDWPKWSQGNEFKAIREASQQ